MFANKRYAESNGWSVDAIIGKTVREAIGEEAWRLIEPQVERVLKGEKVEYIRPLTLPNGEQRFIEVNLIPHFDEQAQMLGAFVLITDITRLPARRARAARQRGAHAQIRRCDQRRNFHPQERHPDRRQRGAACDPRLYARRDDRPRGAGVSSPPEWQQTTTDYLRAGREDPYEAEALHKNGRRLRWRLVGKTVRINDEATRLGVVRDITARKHAEARIQYLAHHDMLTGLPNRAYLTERLTTILALARRHGTLVAIMFIDLDNFKTVNDSLGHHVGDVLLKQIAVRIKEVLREADMVSRLGGDEFLVILADFAAPEDAAKVAEKLLQVISAPVELEGRQVCANASIGISVFPRDGDNADDLIRRADAAMYSAKEHGRGHSRFYTPGLVG